MRRFGQASLAWLGTAAVLSAAALIPSGLQTPASAAPAPLITYIAGVGTTSATTAWLADADGSSPRELGPAATALLSPNGTDVAALDTTDSQKKGPTWTLTLYPTAGGPAQQVYTSQFTIALVPGAWSPDSTLLLFSVGAGPAPEKLMVFSTVTDKATAVASGFFDGESFDPNGPNDIVYALARSSAEDASSNLYVTASNGAGTRQLTHDNESAEPVWGAEGIAYQRLTPRKKGQGTGPEAQLWMIKSGGDGARRLTDMAFASGETGLTPIAFSKNGERLLAELVGVKLQEAYVLDLSRSKVQIRDLTGQRNGTIPDAISLDGKHVLLTTWSATNQAAHSVERVSFAGGKPTVLVKNGEYASWDQ